MIVLSGSVTLGSLLSGPLNEQSEILAGCQCQAQSQSGR